MSHQGRVIFAIQGAYMSITALWPLIHLQSFLQVTGYKTDIWLLKTVSLLLLCIGISFIIQSIQRDASEGIRLLAINVAVTLASIDFYYTVFKVISEVYAIDGFIQLLFVSLWLFRTISKRKFPLSH
jgi:hypothetical protein